MGSQKSHAGLVNLNRLLMGPHSGSKDDGSSTYGPICKFTNKNINFIALAAGISGAPPGSAGVESHSALNQNRMEAATSTLKLNL